MQRFVVPALVAAFLASGISAQAIIAQMSGLPSPDRVITFGANVLPNFTPVSIDFPGITVTHASYFTTGVSNNLVGGFLTNNFSAGPPNTLRIQFTSPITDVSFVYHQIGTSAPTNMRAMLQGLTMDSFSGSWNQSQPNNYFGFTNSAFDEVQIDFVGDFNVDTLAISGPSVARCIVNNGTNVNPLGFTCGTLPVLGTTWEGLVASSPNTLVTFLAWAPGGMGTPLPLFGGEVLVQPAPPPVLFSSPNPYTVPIPSSPTWIGTALTFQGLRLDIVGAVPTIVLLNAIDVVVGT
jgi:hypothetical protein